MSKINNEVSEVNGKSPKTEIYTKKKLLNYLKNLKRLRLRNVD